VGVSRHPRRLSNDDFPEPDAPRIVTNSPAGIEKVTFANASTGVPSPRGYRFDTPMMSITVHPFDATLGADEVITWSEVVSPFLISVAPASRTPIVTRRLVRWPRSST
jgi:hypothetical protein